MKAEGTFAVRDFTPTALLPLPEVVTGTPVVVSTMEKVYTGRVVGRSSTILTAAFDQARGAGSYLAMESFEGSIANLFGSFNFMHSASTSGSDRSNQFFAIVAGSGTGGLKGISGSGGVTVDPDGTHRVWFDYQLEE